MGNVNALVDQKEPRPTKNATTKWELRNVRHERRSVRRASHSERNVEKRVGNAPNKLPYDETGKCIIRHNTKKKKNIFLFDIEFYELSV